MSPKGYSSKNIKDHNTKSDKLKNKVKVYSNIRSNNSYILAKPNEIKLSKTNNKLVAIEEVINQVTTILKAPGIVIIKGKRKYYSLRSTSLPIIDLVLTNSSPSIYKRKYPALETLL